MNLKIMIFSIIYATMSSVAAAYTIAASLNNDSTELYVGGFVCITAYTMLVKQMLNYNKLCNESIGDKCNER